MNVQPSDPRIQLRLHYEQPVAPQRFRISLRGQSVLLAPDDGDSQRAAAYLQSVGVRAAVDDVGLLSFPVTDLERLLDLPERVVVIPTGDAGTLLNLLAHAEGSVLVTLDSPRVLNLSWVDASGECNEPLDLASTPALLGLGVPIVADQETWGVLHAANALPSVLARARVNLDGFVELTTSVPQQVESLEVPGLFRIDETRFGLPLVSARNLDAVPGIAWDGPLPVYDPPPADAGSLPLVLSAASRAHLRVLTDRLAFSRSLAVVWPPGAGRRVFALAAIESLDGFPLTIVTSPSMLWGWRRHLDLLGRRPSLLSRGEVRLVPYNELGLLADLSASSTLLVDDLDRVPSISAVRERLTHLDGDCDGLRLAVSATLPEDDDDLYAYFGVLRPGEFRTGVPAASRYASPTSHRLREHAGLYVLRHSGTVDVTAFRRSEVARVALSDTMRRAFDDLPDPGTSPVRRRETLEHLVTMTREGSDENLGPKIPRALEIVTGSLEAGLRVDVLAGSERCRNRLLGLLGPRATDRLVVHSSMPSTVLDTDVVVVLEYPRSFYAFDDVVVEASDSQGPRRVVLLHVEDSVEDRLAVLALLRSETASSRDQSAEFSSAEVEYLLGLAPLLASSI